jgi:hypothetical protein
MSRLLLLLFLFAFILLGTSCEKNEDATRMPLLEKSWTQSYEESTSESFEVYRPSDYQVFPVSRYRQVFNFKDNHVCAYRVLAPNDGHYMENGSWTYNAVTHRIKIFSPNFSLLYAFEVVELQDNMLKLKQK